MAAPTRESGPLSEFGAWSGAVGQALFYSPRRISVGEDVRCLLVDTGHVLCWGSTGTGQMGNGAVYDALAPVPVRAPR